MGMLGADCLLVDRQGAFEERSRLRKAALDLKGAREVVESRRRSRMLGAKRLLVNCKRLAQEQCGLPVSRAPTEIQPCLVQNGKPVCSVRGSIDTRPLPPEDMRGELGAQRP